MDAVAVLADPTRRALHAHVRAAREPVTREQAAAAVGISRKLAAFHLDKLVAAGLLVAEPHRGPGRTVGRAPTVYRPSPVVLQVAVPHRDYRLLSSMLMEAIVSETSKEPADLAMVRVAGERGSALGREFRSRVRAGRLGAERTMTLLDAALRRTGYEPYRTPDGCLRLGNCPFHELAREPTQTVCALNHAYLTGVVEGMRSTAVDAVLAPRAGDCCVEFRARG